jgi:hypothetical protein
MPLRNVEFAREVYAFLMANPDKHDQNVFWAETRCGTVACVAGTAAILAGATILKLDSSSDDDYVRTTHFMLDPAGKEVMISQFAREALGLDYYDADNLFYSCDSRAEALDYLEKLIEDAEQLQATG